MYTFIIMSLFKRNHNAFFLLEVKFKNSKTTSSRPFIFSVQSTIGKVAATKITTSKSLEMKLQCKTRLLTPQANCP